MEPDLAESQASVERQTRSTALKMAVLALGRIVLKIVAGVIWFFCIIGLFAEGAILIGGNNPGFGALCLVLGSIFLFGGLYWTSPRFKSRSVKRSFTDFGAWMHEASHVAWDAAKSFFQLVVKLAAAGVCIGLLVGGYHELDGAGWITHSHDTPVWIAGDWMVGEYRDCQMRTKTVSEQQKPLDTLDKLPRLFCGEDVNGLFDFQRAVGDIPSFYEAPPPGGMYLFTLPAKAVDRDFHDMPVSYWGRIDRTDKRVIDWRCQRRSASLECNALD